MRSTKKANQWYFGMKVHVGTDTQELAHSLVTTDAAQADFNQLPNLIHGEEDEIYGDSAYRTEVDRHSGEHTATALCRSERKRSIGNTRASVPESSIPSMWSSGSGASPRCAIVAWRRTQPERTQRSG
jgi:IS5 family transposase